MAGDDGWQDWIEAQTEAMVDRVTRWASVSSGSGNLPGLARLAAMVGEDFQQVADEVATVELEPQRVVDGGGRLAASALGDGLLARKRPDAPCRVLLVGHLDTVFPADHPVRAPRRGADGRLAGPGVLDAKGGVAVILTVLQALERCPEASGIGWDVWLAPDEEVGSPGSAAVLRQLAAGARLGLVFEPGHAGGALVGDRKGSGNFVLIVRGRSAHAGRDPDAGRNAVHALAEVLVELKAVDGRGDGIRCNVGVIAGGTAANIVPDLALARFNVRVASPADVVLFTEHLEQALGETRQRDGIDVELHGDFGRPPRVLSRDDLALLGCLAACGEELGIGVSWEPSGGASDANILALAGLPAADGLGPWGGGMHTTEEYLLIESLPLRARLLARFLAGLARGEWNSAEMR